MTTPSSRPRAPLRAALGALLAVLPCALGAQPATAEPSAHGLYNWVHTTGDAERAFAFYKDVLGIELARSPFAGPGAPPEGIRPAAEAGSDELVWNLTNTRGARFRTVFMRAPNTPFGLELSEFFDIPREERAANLWDPGASVLAFTVRDLGALERVLAARGAPLVTLGGRPMATERGRSLVVRDPDGYLIQLTEAAGELRSAQPGMIVGTSIGISVADTATALALYRDLLGLEVRASRRVAGSELALYGLPGGELQETTLAIAGTEIVVRLLEFQAPAAAAPARPFRWRIEDVGAPQFQLEVTGLDALLARTRAAGYRFLSVGGEPIQRPFGRFVFAIDADGVLVEYVEPATRQGQ